MTGHPRRAVTVAAAIRVLLVTRAPTRALADQIAECAGAVTGHDVTTIRSCALLPARSDS